MHFPSTEPLGVFTGLKRYMFWKGAGRRGTDANFAALSPEKNQEAVLHVKTHNFSLLLKNNMQKLQFRLFKKCHQQFNLSGRRWENINFLDRFFFFC